MDIHTFADHIIVWTAVTFAAQVLIRVVASLALAGIEAHERRQRNALHRRWVAARVNAREVTEARLRAEGRWDNYEIQDAMTAAGEAVDPGHRP